MLREDSPRWTKRFVDAANEIQGRITTYMEFRCRLEQLLAEPECPIRRLNAVCSHNNREILAINVGTDDASDPAKKYNLTQPIGPESIEVTLKVDYWVSSNVRDLKPVYALFESYLGITGRRDGLFILDAKRPEVLSALKTAVETYTPRTEAQGLALAYIDLDNFKTVNDTVGHDTGDQALRNVEGHMMELSQSINFIGFSDGGDEYLLLFPEADDFQVLSTIHELRSRVKGHRYGPHELQIDFTAGVARPKHDLVTTLDDLKKRAEDATKQPGQTEGTKADKKRHTVSFDSGTCASNAPANETAFTRLGVAIIRAGCQHPKPFANQVLNFISQEVFEVLTREKVAVTQQYDSIKRVVDELLSWLGTKLDEAIEEHHLIGSPCFAASLPSLAVALAIAHGIFRASAAEASIMPANNFSLTLQIPDGTANHPCLRDEVSNTALWGTQSEGAPWIKVGGQIRVSRDGSQFSPLVVVLQIGLAHKLSTASGIDIPREIFGGIVVVDDRPKTGGGLPDFWQAAIANLAARYIANEQTVRKLVVLGERLSATETVQRLTGEKPVKAEELGALANCSADAIIQFLSWAKSATTFTSNIDDVIEALYDSALQLSNMSNSKFDLSQIRSTPLKRPLATDSLTLPATEGLRCKTLIEAYPAVLDCLRHSDDRVLTWDDANQEMYEVIGFKLLVENPEGNAIPDYWHEEKQSLDAYAENVLLGPDSLIGGSFHCDGQFEQFINHLTGYFKQGKRKTSTRRAILVVPNRVGKAEENNPKPLGLVSIWATPRHSGAQSELTFCFVWRTVEALVGFPYSYYGSVRFAQHVISTINEKLAEVPGQVSRVSLGPLRYLALSLHMRVDDYHRRFAKRIVDAASD